MEKQWPQFQYLLTDRCITYSLRIWHEYYKYSRKEQVKYRKQLREMAAFTKEHYRTVPQYIEGGRKHRIALWLSQYVQWWSFGLFAFADKIKAYCEGMFSQESRENVVCEDEVETAVEKTLPVLETPEPAFSENNIPVILACSDEYVPHAAEVVQSLIDHSSEDFNYDLIFLHTTVTKSNQRVIEGMITKYPNVSIRFFDVGEIMQRWKMQVHRYYSVETFYRLLIPQLLYKYEKVIYLDSDLTILRDIAYLFTIDIGENLLAATLDPGMIARFEMEPEIADYFENILLLKKPRLYFQAGVLVFNIRKFNEVFMPYELLNFAASYLYQYVDQDVLNVKCNGSVYILDERWNVMTDSWGITNHLKAVPRMYQKYLDSVSDPYIIHHAGRPNDRPWNCPTVPLGEYYWKYARKTPFYEITIYRYINQMNQMKYEDSVFDNRSGARKLADKLLPKGSRRREFAKKILPKGSLRWRFCKKIYSFFRR